MYLFISRCASTFKVHIFNYYDLCLDGVLCSLLILYFNRSNFNSNIKILFFINIFWICGKYLKISILQPSQFVAVNQGCTSVTWHWTLLLKSFGNYDILTRNSNYNLDVFRLLLLLNAFLCHFWIRCVFTNCNQIMYICGYYYYKLCYFLKVSIVMSTDY